MCCPLVQFYPVLAEVVLNLLLSWTYFAAKSDIANGVPAIFPRYAAGKPWRSLPGQTPLPQRLRKAGAVPQGCWPGAGWGQALQQPLSQKWTRRPMLRAQVIGIGKEEC